MAGFIRRFGYFPGVEQITLIEGVIIVDLPPPGAVQGIGTGVVGLVGEWPDMTYATSVDASGNILTTPRPIEVFSSQDMLNKVGSFDATIGDFGDSMGNGFVATRNKTYARLVLVPINLASPLGVRVYRQLPGNLSATNPSPVVPMQAFAVPAATEFRTGADRVRLAKRTSFTGGLPYVTGVDGVIAPAGLPAATQTFNSPGADFVTSGVKEGDALVPDVMPPPATALALAALIGDLTFTVVSTSGYPTAGTLQVESEQVTYTGKTATTFTGLTRGVNGTAAAAHALDVSVTLVTDAGTYRVVSVTDANNIVIERQDGSNFTATNWIAGTALPFRLHVASDADSGGNHDNADAIAYATPVRPLDNSIAASTPLNPTITPPAATASSWDPSSGLQMLTTNDVAGVVFDSTVQAPNAAASAEMDALYVTAIDALLSEQTPARDVNILDVARTSANIRTKQKGHVLSASANGVGRTTVIWPPMGTSDPVDVEADTDPGVGGNRDERVDYSWPGATTFVPEAVNFSLNGADGMPHTDGTIDVPGAGWLVSVLSNLPPERNPGQAGPPVPTVLAPVSGLQRGLARELNMNDYIAFRQRGICALRIDRTVGPIFQSGITTSLISGQKNINRRRMADFIEDSLAGRLVQFAKLPMTTQLRDGAESEANAFLETLLSPNNPAAQRIADFSVDPKSGNTPELTAQGIFVLIVRVQTLATADFIVLQAEIGEGVQITTT